MNAPQVGQTFLVTTSEWFFAPDGECYKAVFGTVHEIMTDEETLGIKTNSKSTNWYVKIGSMLIAGCQIHYAIQTNTVSDMPPRREIEHEGTLKTPRQPNSRIFDADADRDN